MDPDSRLSIIIVVFLFIASAFCALVETAIASVSRARVKVASEHGNKRAQNALYVLDHFEDSVSALLVLTNIFHLSGAAITSVWVTRRFGLPAVTIATFAFTLLMFFIGEMLPKSIGNKIPYKISLATSGFLRVLMWICSPISKLLSAFGRFVVDHTQGEEETTVTEEELHDMIEELAEDGALDEEQSELVSSALQFDDVRVSQVLTAKSDIDALEIGTPQEEVLRYVQNTSHSRIVIYENDLDHIVGVLHVRRYLKEYLTTKRLKPLRAFVDPIFQARSNVLIDDLFRALSERRLSMAVVTNAKGKTLGIVTMEDIVEEVFGDIWEEDAAEVTT